MSSTKRAELDPIFKQILINLGHRLQFTPRTEVEVSRLPRTIDAIIELSEVAEQIRLMEQSSFLRLRSHNQIEFKGKEDRLTISGYQIIRGRCMFYLSEHNLLPSQMSVSIVSAGKPNKVLQESEIPFQPFEQEGYYLSNEIPPTLLIVVNELPIIPKNYPILLFASSERKFRELLRQFMSEVGYEEYLQFAYLVRPNVTKEEIMLGDSAYITKENLLFIIDDIGDRLMPLVTDPELAQKSPAVQALLAAERERLRQEVIAQQEQLKAEQEQLMAEREWQVELKKQQQNLLTLLKHRFSELPDSVVERVETTTDMAQLEQWFQQALEGKTLIDMGLLDAPDEQS